MNGRIIAPYGTWESPVTVERVTGRSIGLGAPIADGGDLYWLESRPTETGRSVVVQRSADGTIADVTPPPFDVGSRVHEYGGGGLAVRNGSVVFGDRRTHEVWLATPGALPRRIAGVAGCRYADFSFVPGRDAVVCVREDHRERPPTDPEASLVLLALDGDPGQEGVVLVRGPDFLAAPRVSPDGATLAWIAWNHPDMPWDATALHIARLAGDVLGPPMLIAGGADEAVLQPAWSPAGVLHFCSDRTGWWNVYRVLDGVVAPVTAVAAEIGSPHWVFGQRNFGFLPDGRILVAISTEGQTQAGLVEPGGLRMLPLGPVAQCPAMLGMTNLGANSGLHLACLRVAADAPPAIVLADITAGEKARETVLRSAATDTLDPAEIALGEAFGCATADGEQAHAFWYPPTNARYAAPPEEKPPLVMMIHGGPTSMTNAAFSLRIQWWTSRGFGVVDVNYRGSSGYGRAYRKKLDGAWGVADVEDCIAAARHLVREGKVDGKRLAIRGGSAGGFTALAVLTTSADFAAGASLYGVADLRLLAGDTHKFESRYLDRLIGRLPEDAATYAARSPINHLGNLRAGVIFFQGLDDKVVPPNQARLMAEGMRERGLPVALYEFAGEDHGFRKAETLKRVLELELDFYGRLFGFTPPGLSERVTPLTATA